MICPFCNQKLIDTSTKNNFQLYNCMCNASYSVTLCDGNIIRYSFQTSHKDLIAISPNFIKNYNETVIMYYSPKYKPSSSKFDIFINISNKPSKQELLGVINKLEKLSNFK